MAKKTIVGQVAGTVSDAVASAIDAIAHPGRVASKALGRTATSAKRKVTVKKKAAKKAVGKAVSKTKRAVSKAATRTKSAAGKAKRAVKKVAKKAAKKVSRR